MEIMSCARGEELMSFIERFEPGFSRTVRGCSTDEQARIESICQELSSKPLPEFYRWFLETMGAEMAALDPAGSKFDMSARGVLAAYDAGVVEKVPGYLLVRVVDQPLDDLQGHLVLSRQRAGDAPLVGFVGDLASGSHDPEDEYYLSLCELIAQEAFELFCVRRFPVLREGTISGDVEVDSPGSANDVLSLLEKLGFERMPVTGPYYPQFWREDFAISFYAPPERDPDDGYVLKFGATNEKEVVRVLEVLEDQLHWTAMRTDHIAK